MEGGERGGRKSSPLKVIEVVREGAAEVKRGTPLVWENLFQHTL